MKKLFTNKYFLLGIALLIVVGAVLPSGTALAQTKTQTPGFFECTSNLATCIVYMTSLGINGIIGLFIPLGALFIRLGFEFNATVYDSPLVQNGFGVVLALANLGFVLAMIVIAIATILHSETYGYKKALWRLVIMAILVNFGLVITRPIVNFSDEMSNYFIGATGGNYGSFVMTVTNAFAPQNLLSPPSKDPCETTTSTISSSVCTFLKTIGYYNDPSTGDSFWSAIMSMAFGVFFELVVILVYFSLAILLIVRYVALGMLLVTLPLAWLAWIFPKFQGEFGKWWGQFIKWTFFPPAALFFIYLALITAAPQNTQGQPNDYLTKVANSSGGAAGEAGNSLTAAGLPESALAQAIGGVSPIQTAANEFILAALMLGGLMMASKMTGKAGDFVVGQAKNVSSQVGGYAGRKARRVGTAPLRRPSVRNALADMQQPHRNFATRVLGRLGDSAAHAGGEGAAAEAKKNIKDSPRQNRLHIATTINPDKRLAAISKGLDDKELIEGSITEEERQAYFGKDKKSFYEGYGEMGEKVYKEGWEKSGLARDELLAEVDALNKKYDAVKDTDPKADETRADIDKQIGEKRNELNVLYKKMSLDDPDTLASAFQTKEQRGAALAKAKAGGKLLPATLTLKQESIDAMQDAIIESFTSTFSPTNAAPLLTAISKINGGLKEFVSVVDKKLSDPKKGAQTIKNLEDNPSLVRWFQKNPSNATMIDFMKLFKIPETNDATPPPKP